jgi:ABC-type Na+ efflux pump permease subunit
VTSNALLASSEQEAPTPPNDLRMTWLIACRATVEAFHDQMTLLVNTVFVLVIPLLLVAGQLGPAAPRTHDPHARAAFAATLAVYVLVVGILPSSGAIGIASGVFAGEKEHGILTPLLASPASNGAIFAGKVLGSVIPALLYSLIAMAAYFLDIVLLLGADRLRLLPAGLTLSMVALVPLVAVMGAAVASVISSRVRTYNAAASNAGLVLLPVTGLIFVLAFRMPSWPVWARFAAIVVMVLVDTAIIVLGAATWRREEVMAHQ